MQTWTQVIACDDATPTRVALYHRIANQIILSERLVIVVDLRVLASNTRHRHKWLVRHFRRATLVA